MAKRRNFSPEFKAEVVLQVLTGAYRQIGRFLDEVYMHKRIHSSLGYLTPAEFEREWLALPASPVMMK